MICYVTAKDLREGKPNNNKLCPLVRAISRRTTAEVRVGFWTMTFVRPGKILNIETPPRLKAFIGRFDDGKPCKPFHFTLKGWL